MIFENYATYFYVTWCFSYIKWTFYIISILWIICVRYILCQRVQLLIILCFLRSLRGTGTGWHRDQAAPVLTETDRHRTGPNLLEPAPVHIDSLMVCAGWPWCRCRGYIARNAVFPFSTHLLIKRLKTTNFFKKLNLCV